VGEINVKTLLLLRHAKSSWKDSDLDDHDRPLNKRGKRDAPRMGRLLVDEHLLPDLIVASTAKRARRTAEHVIAESGYRGETRLTGALYMAGPDELRAVVAALPEPLPRVLLIGHNPGLEGLLESLVGNYAPLSTAALAHVELDVETWSQVADQTPARLVKVWQPRELD
jgi:phosphohistidine phosphatase